jgi:hypothetical protein
VVRPFYDGLGAARWRAERRIKREPRRVPYLAGSREPFILDGGATEGTGSNWETRGRATCSAATFWSGSRVKNRTDRCLPHVTVSGFFRRGFGVSRLFEKSPGSPHPGLFSELNRTERSRVLDGRLASGKPRRPWDTYAAGDQSVTAAGRPRYWPSRLPL